MALNLRRKMPVADTLVVHDINAGATQDFIAQTRHAQAAENVRVAATVREVAECSVSGLAILIQGRTDGRSWDALQNPHPIL